ncbi:hypothetical protein ACFL20_12995 [Spirochaetota bacterium]
MKIKIGLDIHGVINTNPNFFVSLAKLIRDEGGEVHIVTGTPFSEAEDELLSYNNGEKWWDYFFSIDDELFEKKVPHVIDKRGGRYYNDLEWNRAKGVYCSKNKIDIHIDDSERYKEFFTTPYLCVKDNI